MISSKVCVCKGEKKTQRAEMKENKKQFLPESLMHVWCVLIAVIRLGWFKINDKPEFTLCSPLIPFFGSCVKIAKFLSLNNFYTIIVHESNSSAAFYWLHVFVCVSFFLLIFLFRSSFLLCNFSRNFIRIIFDYILS